MIVVDASAMIELLLRTAPGLRVEERIVLDDACAPHLMDAEVFHRFTMMGKHGQLDATQVATAVADVRDAPVVRIDHRLVVGAARPLTAALSGYDALYAALAQLADATLVTADAGLARTAATQFGIAAFDATAIP